MAFKYLLSRDKNSFASVYISLYPLAGLWLIGDGGCELVSQSLSNASLSKKEDGEATVAPVVPPVTLAPVVAGGMEDDPAEELGVSPPRKLSRELAAAATRELGRDESMFG